MTAEEKDKFINSKITPALDDALISNYDPLEVKLSNTTDDITGYPVFVTCDFNYRMVNFYFLMSILTYE